jgi:hypothetical protein
VVPRAGGGVLQEGGGQIRERISLYLGLGPI